MGRGVKTDFQLLDAQNFQKADLEKAGQLIRAGALVAFPTETVYGLGANALNPEAVEQIFLAKGRPLDNPLIVHIASWENLEQLTPELTLEAKKLGQHFWPGPLTLVLPRKLQVPDAVTAGLDTVAIRWPDHPVACALIQEAGVPIAAPSANRSGKPSPTEGSHVMEDLLGEVELILDAGLVGLGVESTVLDLTQEVPTILRPGGVTLEALQEVLPQVRLSSSPHSVGSDSEALPSPGMQYTHYAPQKPLYLLEGPAERMVEQALSILAQLRSQGERVGILTSLEHFPLYQQAPEPPDYLQVMGSQDNLADVAQYLFKTLRACDLADVDRILVEGFPETGLGLAIMDRLRRASGGQIIPV